MDRYAVWRRGSRRHISPGTTVNRLMLGEVFLVQAKCYKATTFEPFLFGIVFLTDSHQLG